MERKKSFSALLIKKKMTVKYYLVKCKKCNNTMKYMTSQPKETLSKKTKKCVYCGYNFKISEAILKAL